MLDKPAFPDSQLIAALNHHYPLAITGLTFLPLGADPNAAVYRAHTPTAAWFVKLRRAPLDPMTLHIPHFLHTHGLTAVIPPQPTTAGQLAITFLDFNTMLYPYVEGQDGFTAGLSPHNWHTLGHALRRMHTLTLPPELHTHLRRETYSDEGRRIIRHHLTRLDHPTADPVIAAMNDILRQRHHLITECLDHTTHLARRLTAQPPPLVLCHADLHAWNVLIDTQGELHIVDWDDTLLAPKERDLMFIGAGIGGVWNTPQESAWFYAAYGDAPIHHAALAYYRHERILQDIAVTILELAQPHHSLDNRHQMLAQLESQFTPGGVLDIARRTPSA